MMLILGMTIFIMSMTTRASTNYANLKQSLGTAMYQAARDVAYNQSMDFSDLLMNYEANKDKVNKMYTDNFEARLATLLPDAARELNVKYYNVDASKGLIDCTASYKITLWGKEREVADHETVIIERKNASDTDIYIITLNPCGGVFVNPSTGQTASGSIFTRRLPSDSSMNIENEFGQIQRAGYTFEGWYDAEKGGNAVGNVISNPTGNATYYAHWVKNEYFISYNLDGGHFNGDYPQSFTDVENSDITIPEPVKNGYEFVGWSGTGISGVKKTVVVKKGSRDSREYTAHWKAKTFTATIDTNGGTTTGPLTYKYTPESDDIIIPDPTRSDDFDFAGWERSDGVTKNTGVILHGTKQDISFKAKWQRHSYSITYVYNGGTAVGNADKYVSHGDIVLHAPTRSGYSFIGWTDQVGNEYEASSVVTLQDQTGDKTFYANWAPDMCTITFNLGRASWQTTDDRDWAANTANTKVPYGYIINTYDIPTPVKNGLIFDGWYLADSTVPANGYVVTGDVVLFPKFIGDKDTFTQKISLCFQKKDGSFSNEIPFMEKDMNWGSHVIIEAPELQKFIRDNQTQLVADGIDDAATDETAAKTYDLTKLSVSSMNPPSAFVTKTELNGTESYSTLGYGQGDTTGRFEYIVSDDASAVLNVMRNTVTVTYKGMPGTSWPSDLTSESIYGGSVKFVGDVDEYQKVPDYHDGSCVGIYRTHTHYEETDDSGNHTTVENPDEYVSEEINDIPEVLRPGYDFDGWYLEKQKVDDTMTATQDETFVQKWTPHVYDILYNLDDRSYSHVTNTENPKTYTIESNDITLKNPSRPGYVFDGWSERKDPSVISKNVVIKKGTLGTLEYTAHWTPIVYALHFDTASKFGVLPSNMPGTYTIEDDITVPNPTRQGYTSDGWKENVTDGVAPVAENGMNPLKLTHVYGNRSFTALWEQTVKQTDYTSPGYIVEPAWNADNAKNVPAGESVAKDPRLHSSISVDSYGYIEVKVPKILVQMRANGEKVVKDAFTLEGIDYTNFKLIAKADSSEAGGVCTYLFAYKNVIPANGETPALFTSIKAMPFAALYNSDGSYAESQSVKGNVMVTGIVTNVLAEDDEDMASSLNAAETRNIYKKSDASSNPTVDVSKMYDESSMTTPVFYAYCNYAYGGSMSGTYVDADDATTKSFSMGTMFKAKSTSVTVTGPSAGWADAASGSYSVMDFRSPIGAPWGRKMLMSFSIYTPETKTLLIDFNANKNWDDGNYMDGANTNDAYGDTRCYIDGKESMTAREAEGVEGSSAMLTLTGGSWHQVTLVASNTSSLNPQHQRMYTNHGIGFVQAGGTSNYIINNVRYTVTD